MAVSLTDIIARAKTYPARASRFGRTLSKLAESVKAYVDAKSAADIAAVIVDEDNMASDSDELVPTQQSVKAYVDSAAAAAATAAAGLAIVGADDGLTVNDDGNVAGLASSIALANSLKATMNLHYADAGVSGEEHLVADTAIASDDADDLTSLIALISEMLTSYAAHDDDAILGSPTIHQAQGTEKALASAVAPTTLAECISRANDLKAKLNDHMDDGTAHTAGDSAQEAEDDAAMGVAVNVPVTSAAASDLVIWGILNGGTGSVTGVSAVASTGQVLFTFSADPQADTIISYVVLRDPV